MRDPTQIQLETNETAVQKRGKVIDRRQAAAVLGVSEATIVRRERALGLRRKRRGNRVVYDAAEVTRLIERRRTITARPAEPTVTPEIASAVFAALDDGLDGVAVVRRLVVHPNLVETLVAQHARLRAGLVLSATHLAMLGDAALLGAAPRSGEELLDGLRVLIESRVERPCRACERRGAVLCAACAALKRQSYRRHPPRGESHGS